MFFSFLAQRAIDSASGQLLKNAELRDADAKQIEIDFDFFVMAKTPIPEDLELAHHKIARKVYTRFHRKKLLKELDQKLATKSTLRTNPTPREHFIIFLICLIVASLGLGLLLLLREIDQRIVDWLFG